jgi:hypothetical protein
VALLQCLGSSFKAKLLLALFLLDALLQKVLFFDSLGLCFGLLFWDKA